MTRAFLRAAAFGTTLLTAAATPVQADSKDYEFQLVDKDVKQGDTTVAVKLVHKSSGKPVPDAVIFAKRIDMGPDQMEGMTATLEPLPSAETGHYRFKTNLSHGGTMGAVSRRQSAGRNRDGRRQTDRHGGAMTRGHWALVSVAAIAAAAGAGIFAGQRGLVTFPIGQKHAGDARTNTPFGSGHLLPRSRRKTFIFACAKIDF